MCASRRCRTILAAAACLGIALAALPALAGAASPPGPLVSCPPRLACGVISVPIDHAAPDGGRLQLVVSRLRPKPGPSGGALLFLTGGPGQASVARLDPDVMVALRDLSLNREVIAVDMRGTGRSGALGCPSLDRPAAGAADDPAALEAAVAGCARELGPTRRFFTTPEAIEDLELVRRQLGIERWALAGVSYGTYVATRYARTYPQRVDRLLLDSLVPVDGVSPTGADSLAATGRILGELCSAGACRGITRDLAADVARLEARLSARSIPGTVVDRRGVASRRPFGGPGQAGLVFRALLGGDLSDAARASFPAAVRAALDGDATLMWRILGAGAGDDSSSPTRQSEAAFLASVCQDTNLPWQTATPIDARRRAGDDQAVALGAGFRGPFSPLAAAPVSPSVLCRGWPEAAEAAIPAGALPDIPVLVLAGSADVRTPLEGAERLRRQNPRTEVVVAAHRGHSVLGREVCAATAVRRFFAGLPVGRPCAGLRRPRLIPLPPSRLAAVRTGPAGERAARSLVAAVASTLDDFPATIAFAGPTSLGARATGLRGGFVDLRLGVLGLKMLFDRFEYVPGVRVSGVLIQDALLTALPVEGRLVITSPAGRAVASLGASTIRLRLNGARPVAAPSSFSPLG
jgi:pimeloyl-ACP methyl ester carboxylesterase